MIKKKILNQCHIYPFSAHHPLIMFSSLSASDRIARIWWYWNLFLGKLKKVPYPLVIDFVLTPLVTKFCKKVFR